MQKLLLFSRKCLNRTVDANILSLVKFAKRVFVPTPSTEPMQQREKCRAVDLCVYILADCSAQILERNPSDIAYTDPDPSGFQLNSRIGIRPLVIITENCQRLRRTPFPRSQRLPGQANFSNIFDKSKSFTK